MTRARLALLVLLAGCANIQAPPGGPPDRAPPLLLATVPESLWVYKGWKGDAEFVFDEVVSEGSSPNFGLGTGDLEKQVLLSPSSRVPVVRWKRNRITVHPREGWQPNLVYRVELLPGLADLRNNRTPNGRVITFTTGATLPVASLNGMVVDWTTQRPMRLALVEAVHQGDSLAYRTVTDSAGKFTLEPVPDGEYLVYGVQDQNNNRIRESRESFDSVRAAQGHPAVGEIWVFKHDSTAARLSTAAQNDTLSLVLTFSQSLNPYQRLPADSVEVRLLPDSTVVPVLAILPKGQYDTAYPPARLSDSAKAKVDSARIKQDSIRADSIARARLAAELRIAGAQRRRGTAFDTTGTGPLRTKPPLFDKLYVRVGTRLLPGKNYAVIVKGIQSVSRVAGSARSVAQIPVERPPPDSAKAKADSLKVKPDTARRPR